MNSERKLFGIVLAIYWAGIFTVTHIPVPTWTRNMGMSDKTMHIVAYMLLAFLLWFAVDFKDKANWRTRLPWLAAGAALLYAGVDEISQIAVGRGTELLDFVSDLGGIAAAMLTVTFLPGRRAVIIPAAVCPVLFPGLVRAGFITQGTIYEVGIYFICFAVVSLLFGLTIRKKFIGLFAAAADIAFVKLYATLTDKVMGQTAILSSLAATILIFAVLFYVEHIKRGADKI